MSAAAVSGRSKIPDESFEELLHVSSRYRLLLGCPGDRYPCTCRSLRINKHLDASTLRRFVRFPQAYGLDLRVFELEVLDQIVAHHHGTRFGKQAVGLAVALHVGVGRNDGYTEVIRLEEVSRVIEGLFILQLGSIRLVEDLLSLVAELFRHRLFRKLRDLVLSQIGGALITSFLEKAPQEEIVLQSFHVFLKRG